MFEKKPDKKKTIAVRMTEAEHSKVKEYADEHNVDVSRFIRTACRNLINHLDSKGL